jgi:4-hydroxybenzoyl-CoA thioesterase
MNQSKMLFTTHKKTRFQHCDPAGIVFYPQYFVLLHEVQKDFLAHLEFPEDVLIRSGKGLPIVDLKTRFVGMCRHGDVISISLALTRLGHASVGMHYEIAGPSRDASNASVVKLQADTVVVYMDLASGKPIELPAAFRTAMHPYLSLAEALHA